MSKKLMDNFVDEISSHICEIFTNKCDEQLEKYGLQTKYISNENKRDLCFIILNKNFDSLLEECKHEYWRFENILAEMIFEEFECIKNDKVRKFYVDFTGYYSFPIYDYFTTKNVEKIKKIIAEDECNYLAEVIFNECLSKIKPACELTDVIYYNWLCNN